MVLSNVIAHESFCREQASVFTRISAVSKVERSRSQVGRAAVGMPWNQVRSHHDIAALKYVSVLQVSGGVDNGVFLAEQESNHGSRGGSTFQKRLFRSHGKDFGTRKSCAACDVIGVCVGQ